MSDVKLSDVFGKQPMTWKMKHTFLEKLSERFSRRSSAGVEDEPCCRQAGALERGPEGGDPAAAVVWVRANRT